jgi:hypothetical protein
MVTTQLDTIDAVVDALGGTGVVAGMVKNTDAAVSNWRKAGQFPANTYLIIRGELEKLNKTAPDTLWAMKMAVAS